MSFLRFLGISAALAVPALSQTGGVPVAKFWTHDSQGPAQNTPCEGNATVELLGNVTAPDSRSSRDVGFHGRVGKFEVNTYGDTSQCPEGAQLDNCWDGANFVGSNSAALDTDNPLIVQDFNLTGGDRSQQFCAKMDIPEEQDNVFFAIGTSNVIETGENTGIIFTAMNNRTMNGDGTSKDHMLGAGIGIIDASGDFPTCTRKEQLWWDASEEPLWGDHNVVDGMDGFLYFFGGMMGGDIDSQLNVYAGRVPKNGATDLSQYTYWNGQAYTPERLKNPTPSQAILQGVPPGQIFWNPYLFKWVSLSRDPLDMWGLGIQTSVNIHGPWSELQKVYHEDCLTPQPIAIYSPAAHTQYDPTGKTLIVTYAAYGPIQAIKLTFNKD
ncbi:MAG: hypothetical protein Q9162_007266 [Coniocarpon cinnabarinum]